MSGGGWTTILNGPSANTQHATLDAAKAEAESLTQTRREQWWEKSAHPGGWRLMEHGVGLVAIVLPSDQV